MEVELALELLILGLLLWLVYTRSREEEVEDVVDDPDYVARFKELGADALLEVMEKRKTTVEEVVLEDLPLDEIRSVNEEILEKFGELETLKAELTADNEKTRDTTRGLSRAMSAGIGERGRWGESTFEAILKMSGLVEDVNYYDNLVLTKSTTNPKARPDFVVQITDGSTVAVDAKGLLGPLVKMYDDAMELDDPKNRDAAFKDIADNIWGAVKGISDRDYPTCLKEHFGHQGPSFTIVFIPASHVLEMAYKNDKGHAVESRKKVPLQEAAYLKGVLLASPTMVMALLSMIRDEWAAYQVDRKTEEIKALTVEMYERHILFGNRLAGVGKGLKDANQKYADAVTTFQGKQGIKNTGQKMIDYGIKASAGGKELKELPDISDFANPDDVEDLTELPSEDG
ncbi:MAG: DNA recombination protein RmuC [Candidatus Thermoplasmatota archaeon]|nr:DNA recombination protein RmuC [Candidatus Thermoplasmatota archaeon]